MNQKKIGLLLLILGLLLFVLCPPLTGCMGEPDSCGPLLPALFIFSLIGGPIIAIVGVTIFGLTLRKRIDLVALSLIWLVVYALPGWLISEFLYYFLCYRGFNCVGQGEAFTYWNVALPLSALLGFGPIILLWIIIWKKGFKVKK